MPWWGYLIIAAILVIAALIAGFVWGRKSSPAEVDREGLAAAERKALEAEIEAEKVARATAEQARDELAKDLKATLAWYNAQKDAITDAAQKEFAALVTDPDQLDVKLDALLGAADEGPLQADPPGERGDDTV